MSACDKVNDLEFFLKIVEAGSLTRAAILLESSLPSMSRRLSQLEQRLGVKLIDRNARRFKLTEKGQYFLEQTQQIVLLIENMENTLQSGQEVLNGILRIGSLIQFGKGHLAGWITEFSTQHPNLKIELILSDSKTDLLEQELDFSFQIEAPVGIEYGVMQVFQGKKIYCASPEYLQKYGIPSHPKDLIEHNCICLIRNRHTFNEWSFMDYDHEISIKVSPKLASDSSDIVRQWVLDGLGIAYKLNWDIHPDLVSGKIVECLEEFNPFKKSLYLVYLRDQAKYSKYLAFLNFIHEKSQQLKH
ncbi:LysR family transcriptional regulator [Acinetobacter sp. ANC 4639]